MTGTTWAERRKNKKVIPSRKTVSSNEK